MVDYSNDDGQLIKSYFYTMGAVISSYRFANKTRNLLFTIQLVIYIIYGDNTIIGFFGFVANLLNRPTDGATVSVRKRVTFRPLVSTSVK
jgi:hypothetical protein